MFSFSQNFEDVYIARAFSEKKVGFYIDAGAYHPVVDSVTKFFYDRGWSGINLEPGPSFDQFKDRVRDINLPYALGPIDGECEFEYNSEDPGTSRIVSAGEGESVAPTRIRSVVPTRTLSSIIDVYAPGQKIDFLKIDIEGQEWDVLSTTDWRKYRPELILVECTLPYSTERRDDGWSTLMTKFGYKEVFFDGVNVYYLASESIDRRSAFAFPVNVLDGVRKFDPLQHGGVGFDMIHQVKRDLGESRAAVDRVEQVVASELAAVASRVDVLGGSIVKKSSAEIRAIISEEVKGLGRGIDELREEILAREENEADLFSGLKSIAHLLGGGKIGTDVMLPNSASGLIDQLQRIAEDFVREKDEVSKSLSDARRIMIAREAEFSRELQEAQQKAFETEAKLNAVGGDVERLEGEVAFFRSALRTARQSRDRLVALTANVYENVVPATAETPVAVLAGPTIEGISEPPQSVVEVLAHGMGVSSSSPEPAEPHEVVRLRAQQLDYAQVIGPWPSGSDGRTFRPASLLRRLVAVFNGGSAVRHADALRDSGNFVEAAIAYRKAYSLFPDRVDLCVQLGNMLKDSGAFAEAELAYRCAIAKEPCNPDTFLQFGHLCRLSGRMSLAIASFQHSLALDDEAGRAREILWEIELNR